VDGAKSVEQLREGLVFQEGQLTMKALSQEWRTSLREHWLEFVKVVHTSAQFALAYWLLEEHVAFNATYPKVCIHPLFTFIGIFFLKTNFFVHFRPNV